MVSGLGKLEREALASEVLGAIGPGRSGLSVDLVADNGRCLEVHRPLTGPCSVRDAVTCEDVTNAFLFGETVDVLGALGLSRGQTRSTLHFSDKNLKAVDDLDATVVRLGSIDQTELWSAAIKLAEVEVEMASVVDEAILADPLEDYAEEIEEAHAGRDIAADQLEKARSQLRSGSLALAFIGVAVGLITHPFLAVPFLSLAIGVGVRAWRRGQDYETASAFEIEVLSKAGVASYLNFQLKKVDELTSNNAVRSRSLELAELHRQARTTWESITGKGISLEWAAGQRAQITAAASRIDGGSGYPAGHAMECFARAFVNARSSVGESLPLVVDEPFTTVGDPELLEILSAMETYAAHMQYIVMSNDDRVLRWIQARTEQGTASLVRLGSESGREQRPTTTPLEIKTSSPSIARPTSPLIDEAVRVDGLALQATVPAVVHQLN